MLAPIAHPRLEGWISWYGRQRRGIQAIAAPNPLLEPTRISRMRPSVQLGQNVSIFVQVPWRLGLLDRLQARLFQRCFEPQVDGTFKGPQARTRDLSEMSGSTEYR